MVIREEVDDETHRSLLVVAWLLIPTAISVGSTLHITPTESLSVVREKLTADATITEVVFAEGSYRGGLFVEGPEGTDFAQHPLLIRAAEGANVVFDGARPVEEFPPHEELRPAYSGSITRVTVASIPSSGNRERASATASWPIAWPWHGFQRPTPSKANACCSTPATDRCRVRANCS